ncbi:MAG: phosphoglycerate mutase family protein [Pseudomonadota bacterium]
MASALRPRRYPALALLLSLALLAGCAQTTVVPESADSSASSVDNTVTTVLLVRHAEKAANQGHDPELTATGHQRAARLASMLADLSPDIIFATQFKRTQQTVAPLAKSAGLDVTTVQAADIDSLAQRIREQHAGDTVVIAAHSNTVPAIIEALGSEPVPAIPESEYTNLYIVSLPATGIGKTTRLHFPAQ